MGKVTVKAIRRFCEDGAVYIEGAILEMDEARAKALMESKSPVVEIVKKAKAADAPPKDKAVKAPAKKKKK